MKPALYFLPFVLAACQATSSNPAVGSHAWMAWAEQKAGVTDGQGHGPDHGSQEWCDALHYRVYGVRAENGAACDRDWMVGVDRALRGR